MLRSILFLTGLVHLASHVAFVNYCLANEGEASGEQNAEQETKIDDDTVATGVRVRDCHLVGKQLRMIVEQYRQERLNHKGVVKWTRGYVVIVELDKNEETTHETHLIGPLWTQDKPQSSFTFRDGIVFTDEDRKALAARPIVFFNESGEALRKRSIPNSQDLAVERLDLQDKSHQWLRLGVTKPLPEGLDWTRWSVLGSYVTFDSKREVLTCTDETEKTIRVFESVSGREIDDTWLNKTIQRVRKLEDAYNSFAYLTQDRNYVVVWPEPSWQFRYGEHTQEFTFDGKKRARSKLGVLYSRLGDKVSLLKKSKEDKWIGGQRWVFTIDGELLILENPGDQLTLSNGSGHIRHQIEVKPPTKRERPVNELFGTLFGVNHVQLDEKNERIIFVGQELLIEDCHWVIQWNYKNATLDQFVFGISDLFGKRSSPSKRTDR